MYVLLCKGAMFFRDLVYVRFGDWPSLGPFICNVFDFFFIHTVFAEYICSSSVQCVMKTGTTEPESSLKGH